MAGFTELIQRIKVIVEDSQLGKLRKGYKNLRKEAEAAFKTIDKANKRTAASGKMIARRLKAQALAARRFRGELLSIMFFGMAINRVFGGFLRTSFKAFQEVTEGTSRANNALTKLNAAWQFLKFSLIDALLESPFFRMMIEWAIKIIDKINGFNSKTKAWIVGIIVALALLGLVLMLYGMIGLGLIALQTVTAGWLFGLTALKSFVLTSLIPALAGIATALAVLGILVGIFLVIQFIQKLKEKIGSWKEFWIAVLRGLARSWGIFANVIVEIMGPVFDWLVDGFVSALKLVRELLQAATGIPGKLGEAAQAALDFIPDKQELDSFKNFIKQTGAIPVLIEKALDKFAPLTNQEELEKLTFKGLIDEIKADLAGVGEAEGLGFLGRAAGDEVINSNNEVNIVNINNAAQQGETRGDVAELLRREGFGSYVEFIPQYLL